MLFKRIAFTLATMALSAAPAMFAQTNTTATRDFTIGPVGVGSTETVQINVANLAPNSSSGTAASCTGSVTFNNSTGNAIGTSTSFTLSAGQISSVSLPFAKVTSGTARVEVIGVISRTISASTQGPCNLVYSLETYDTTTGATHIYVSGSVQGGGGFPGGR